MKKRPRPLVSAKNNNQVVAVPTAPGSVRLVMFAISESTALPPLDFSRRQGVDMSAFDKLRVSGGNGVFNLVPAQHPVSKAEDICELCAPIEKVTIGVICIGCQKILDDGLAEIVDIPAHFLV